MSPRNLTEEEERIVNIAFRPHTPIDDPDAFFGRELERERVREALATSGLHVVVYGERGCGKTSLVNIATKGPDCVDVFCEKNSDFSRLMRNAAVKLAKFDPKRFVFHGHKKTLKPAGTEVPHGNMTGSDLLSMIPDDKPLCLVFDELDRVRDIEAIEGVAELVKNAATNKPLLTLVMVGVAATAGAVLRGHASNERHIREIQLDRMQEDELRGIVRHGEQVLAPLKLKFADDVATEILHLCDRMPYYLHLMASNAAKAALKATSPVIEMEDLSRGCIAAAKDADQQLHKSYQDAARSSNGSHIHQRVIWGMANLTTRNNSIAEITAEAAKIVIGKDPDPPSNTAVGSALRRLMDEDRGRILIQTSRGNYAFASPLMKGYIRLIRQS